MTTMRRRGSRRFHAAVEGLKEDRKRWPALVGCSARDLVDAIVQQWPARAGAVLAWDAPALAYFLGIVAVSAIEGLECVSDNQIFERLHEMHGVKSADYGRKVDPFANFRASKLVGVEPWRGALLRAGDKVARLSAWLENGRLENEGVVDSLYDLISYVLIARILWLEEQVKANDPPLP